MRDVFDQAGRGTLPGMVRTGATFKDAAAEFLRYAEHDLALKPSTLRGYRSIIDAYLLRAFGERRLEDITTLDVERWRSSLTGVGNAGRNRGQASAAHDPGRCNGASRPRANNSKNRIMVLLHGVFTRACKVYGPPLNPVSGIERHPVQLAGDIDVFSRRRCGRSYEPPHPSRTQRSTSPPPSRGYAAASFSRCAGATSTSRARSCAFARATPARR
jgi:hypothetical protein